MVMYTIIAQCEESDTNEQVSVSTKLSTPEITVGTDIKTDATQIQMATIIERVVGITPS